MIQSSKYKNGEFCSHVYDMFHNILESKEQIFDRDTVECFRKLVELRVFKDTTAARAVLETIESVSKFGEPIWLCAVEILRTNSYSSMKIFDKPLDKKISVIFMLMRTSGEAVSSLYMNDDGEYYVANVSINRR